LDTTDCTLKGNGHNRRASELLPIVACKRRQEEVVVVVAELAGLTGTPCGTHCSTKVFATIQNIL
jgi:hypothetical protein